MVLSLLVSQKKVFRENVDGHFFTPGGVDSKMAMKPFRWNVFLQSIQQAHCTLRPERSNWYEIAFAGKGY